MFEVSIPLHIALIVYFFKEVTAEEEHLGVNWNGYQIMLRIIVLVCTLFKLF